VLICAWALLCGLTPARATDAPLAISADGQQLIDAQHGVWWSRCPEGMAWRGRQCQGTPQLMSQPEALKHAAARNTPGEGWRLPRAAELHRLFSADSGPKHPTPLLDALRDVDPDWYWSASASVDTGSVNTYSYGNIMRGLTSENANHMSFLHGWAVNARHGETRNDITKKTKLPVLLVRPAPAD
jgi:hypothetical protein